MRETEEKKTKLFIPHLCLLLPGCWQTVNVFVFQRMPWFLPFSLSCSLSLAIWRALSLQWIFLSYHALFFFPSFLPLSVDFPTKDHITARPSRHVTRRSQQPASSLREQKKPTLFSFTPPNTIYPSSSPLPSSSATCTSWPHRCSTFPASRSSRRFRARPHACSARACARACGWGVGVALQCSLDESQALRC